MEELVLTKKLVGNGSYSLRGNKQGYNEFDYRRLFTFGDFLEELKRDKRVARYKQTELDYIANLIKKGNQIQALIEKTPKDNCDYEEFVKVTLRNINLQDVIIEKIDSYIDGIAWFIANKSAKIPKDLR